MTPRADDRHLAGPDGLESFIEAASGAGWRIERRDPARPLELPADVIERYGSVPSAYHAFMSKVAHASTEGAWFNCEAQFSPCDPKRFRWNEVEHMMLDTADTEAERGAVVAFWNRHLPIMMAPASDYDYIAIVVGGADDGVAVHGYAPEFELAKRVAASFDEWLSMLARALREPETAARGPLALRVMSDPLRKRIP